MADRLPDVKIDKSSWGDGPWQHEPDRVEWEQAGLPCLMVRHPRMGHWCGYVAVPPGHPLHGKSYDDADVDVHGGLTYGNVCSESNGVCHVPKPGEPDNVFWFGFDCAHSGDFMPSSNLLWGMGYPWPERKYDHAAAVAANEWHVDQYRTLEYVQVETNRLAAQLRSLMSVAVVTP